MIDRLVDNKTNRYSKPHVSKSKVTMTRNEKLKGPEV